jgi:hypothetical protein
MPIEESPFTSEQEARIRAIVREELDQLQDDTAEKIVQAINRQMRAFKAPDRTSAGPRAQRASADSPAR